jgi:hypothetical protein
MAITIPPITDIMYVIGGIFMNIESAAVRPLNIAMSGIKAYMYCVTLCLSLMTDV